VAGDNAEREAERFLAARGLSIVARNFRTRLGEVDLVALDGRTLVFVEVRQRTASTPWGGAAGSIDGRKRHRLEAAARQFLARLPEEPPCRFDVLTLQAGEWRWLRDAFSTAC
jgi:putative endonuclease